jgi:peptidoglycan/LPS O-acetylase OafA/YrhL
LNITEQLLSDKRARVESLDFLRGIAACAVMLFHYTAATSISLSEDNPLRMIGVYGHFGVEVFFILSGFIIPYSLYRSSYKVNLIDKFLLKRMIRIEIPFLAIIGVEVFLIYVSSLTPWKNGVSDRLDVYNIALHAGYLNGVLGKPWLIPVFWTLAIEFQFYLLIALLFPLFIQARFIIRVSAISGLGFLSFALPQSYLFFSYGLFFLMGIVAFQLKTGIIKYGEFFLLVLGILFFLYIQRELLSLVIVTFTLIVILFFKRNWRLSTFFGMISYSLYLIHVPFGGRLLMLTQIYIYTEWVKTVLIVVYLVATIFVAWAFYLIVEKPSLGLSKSILYK